MKSLEPFRDDIVVMSGLAQVTGRALGDGPGDHARATATWLTGVHPYKTGGADFKLGISADQIAAQEFGKHTQLASLELALEQPPLAGNCDSGYTCAYMSMSWRSETSPLPGEINPRMVFERLFGDGESTEPTARMARLESQKSVLDYVTASLTRLQGTLGAGDKRKLDEYLAAVRDIERRIQRAEEQNITMKLPHMERPSSIPDDYEEYCKLMMDLQVIAWQTDMTRVTSFTMGRDGSNRAYREIGISDGHHSISHHQQDPERVEKLIKIDEMHTQMFAYLVREAEEHQRRRRIVARSLAHRVRQQLERVEHSHARRSADLDGRQREWPGEGQSPSRVSEGNAAEQPVPEHVRRRGRARREGLRRQHGTAHGSVGLGAPGAIGAHGCDGCGNDANNGSVRLLDHRSLGKVVSRTVIMGLALMLSAPVLAQEQRSARARRGQAARSKDRSHR